MSRARVLAPALVALVAATLALAAGTTNAASSTTVVSVTVPGATTLATTCATGVADVTAFGTMLPGDARRTGSDCIVDFGSSNDTATLRAFQDDSTGPAMWRLPHGPLDTGMGGDGISDVAMDATPPGWAPGADAARAADRDVLLGTTDGGGTSVVVWRIDPTGALDNTFGVAGKATLPGFLTGGAITEASDGKVYVVGQNSTNDLRLARLSATGQPDSGADADPAVACDGDGVAEPALGTVGSPGHDVILDEARGRIYVAASFDNGANNDIAIIALRMSDCGLDTTFSGNGEVSYAAPTFESPTRLLVQQDGKVLAIGNNGAGGAAAFRVDTSGAPDASWGPGGLRTISWNANDAYAMDVVQRADGDIVVLADVHEGCGTCNRGFGVAVLDDVTGAYTTWNGDGRQVIQPTVNHDSALAVVRHPDESLTLVGGSVSGTESTAAVRLRPDGELDTDFSADGIDVRDVPGTSVDDRGQAAFVDADGRVVVTARQAQGGGVWRQRIVRYATTTLPDYAGGTNDWAVAGASFFGVCLSQLANATSVWTVNAGCTAGNGAWWNPLATTRSLPGSRIATTAANVANGQARFRFGVRLAAGQGQGRYFAPVVFEVTAPST